MSEPKLREFITGDFDDLKVDTVSGDLYWKGKRLWSSSPEEDAEANLRSTETVSRLEALLERQQQNITSREPG